MNYYFLDKDFIKYIKNSASILVIVSILSYNFLIRNNKKYISKGNAIQSSILESNLLGCEVG